MGWDRFRASDEELMERTRDHDDHQAFALLMKRWEAPVERLCYRMLGDAHLAEDMRQETFARLFASRSRYTRRAKFSTYIWRIAINRCLDELRRKRRETEAMERMDPPTFAPPNAEAELIQREEAEAVRRAVMSLDEKYRAVVALRHYEGLKFRETAEILEIPVGTAKSRMAEALNQLARRLKPLLRRR